jgi:hypothetical protein
MSYTLHFAKPFLKSLKSLDQVTIKRIHLRLQELAQDPFDPRISGQVEMQPGERESRVGDGAFFMKLKSRIALLMFLPFVPDSRPIRKEVSVTSP